MVSSVKEFWTFDKKLSANLSKVNFYVSRGTFDNFLWESYTTIHKLRIMSKKLYK